ncbi:MAG: hypothetical protein M1820_002200 [Bogoriella megaspora]|nr:MAG: hypothetical protein M1820_002200 [Bogoriella megaspora]
MALQRGNQQPKSWLGKQRMLVNKSQPRLALPYTLDLPYHRLLPLSQSTPHLRPTNPLLRKPTLTNPTSSTSAPPIYLLLFITATYFLNRPCVYCSLLLAILVLSLFDFRADWFEPRSSFPHSPFSPAPKSSNNNSSDASASNMNSSSVETIGVVAEAVVETASGLLAAAAEGVRRKVVGESQSGVVGVGVEGLRTVFGKREWRVPCLDILVRL